MEWMMALGLHGLLMLFYVIMVSTGRSRMHLSHLLLALFLPFVGECCLLAAESGRIPEKPLYERLSASEYAGEDGNTAWELPANWRDILHGEEGRARTLLLQIISHRQPWPYVHVLRDALQSPNSEVTHIAAVVLMKLHQQCENHIRLAAQVSWNTPGDLQSLSLWIDAIKRYRCSSLTDGAALDELIREETVLTEAYLAQMPGDNPHRAELVRLHLAAGNPHQAWMEAERLLRDFEDSSESWELAISALEADERYEEADTLRRDRERVGVLWGHERNRGLSSRKADAHA